jgi:hypothetical protein
LETLNEAAGLGVKFIDALAKRDKELELETVDDDQR